MLFIADLTHPAIPEPDVGEGNSANPRSRDAKKPVEVLRRGERSVSLALHQIFFSNLISLLQETDIFRDTIVQISSRFLK